MHGLALLLLSLTPFAGAQGKDAACMLRGRLLDAQGAPVAGAELSLHGWEANRGRVQTHGVPAGWQDPAPVTSDAGGRFELRCVPPRAFQFVLEVNHDDFGKIGWRWSELEPGSELDLGDIELEPPGVLVGHIVDAEGELLVEGWRVSATHLSRGVGRERSGRTSHARVDPTTGRFRIDDLPPGRLSVSAGGLSGASVTRLPITVSAGVVTETEIVYSGPDPRRRIKLITRVDRLYIFHPVPGSVHLIDAYGARTPLQNVANSTSLWEANELEPGTYALEIDDPRFEPWRREGVHTGTQTVAHLIGSVDLQLTVRTPGDELPVDEYGLLIEYSDTEYVQAPFTLAEDGAAAPRDGVFRGIVPGECTLELRVAGHPSQLIPLWELQPGETRALDVTLGSGATLTGQVLLSNGAPVEGARVEITRGELPGHSGRRGSIQHAQYDEDGSRDVIVQRYRDAETTTDAEGRLQFESLPFETYVLRAFIGRWLVVDTTVRLEGRQRMEVRVNAPPAGAVDLRVALPEGAAAERVRVSVSPEALSEPLWNQRRRAGVSLGADGRCRLERLPAGELALELQIEGLDDGQERTRYVSVGTVQVVADELTAHAVSPAANSGSELTVRAFANGSPLPRARMDLIPLAPGVPQPNVVRTRGGELRVPELVPATYRMLIRNRRKGWAWEHPELVRIELAATLQLDVHVPLVERRLRVRDARGEPLVREWITWWPESLEPGWARAHTGADGVFDLALPVGSYHFARRGAHEAIFALDWVPGEGEIEVVLPDGE